MSELVRRQHFVPRVFLKNFARQSGSEWYISALKKEEADPQKILELNTKKVANQRDLYTLPGETIEQKMAIEKFYSENFEQDYLRTKENLEKPLSPEKKFSKGYEINF